MPRKKKSDEVSIADLAKRGLERIVKLSQSQIISEKLQSFNILLFVFILTVVVTYYVVGPTVDLSFLLVAGVMFLLALVATLAYEPVLSIVSNVSANKIGSLRIGITMLFVSLTLGITALAFNVKILANLSLGLIGLQLVIIPISGFLVPKISTEDKEVDSSQIWIALGRISSIIGLISFIIDIALLLIKFGI